MNRSGDGLMELAEAAKAAQTGNTDEILQQFIEDAIHSYGNLMLFNDMLYTFDYASIYRRRAEQLGKDELTDLEWKQAVLDAVLEQGRVE